MAHYTVQGTLKAHPTCSKEQKQLAVNMRAAAMLVSLPVSQLEQLTKHQRTLLPPLLLAGEPIQQQL